MCKVNKYISEADSFCEYFWLAMLFAVCIVQMNLITEIIGVKLWTGGQMRPQCHDRGNPKITARAGPQGVIERMYG